MPPPMLTHAAFCMATVVADAAEPHAPRQRKASAALAERHPRADVGPGEVAAARRAMGSDPISPPPIWALVDPRGLTPFTTRRRTARLSSPGFAASGGGSGREVGTCLLGLTGAAPVSPRNYAWSTSRFSRAVCVLG
jgi:hypothetical protein